jgi:Abnormal spindle-like microcephaly-assoc'd, ASPM-SPD-2-Hydin
MHFRVCPKSARFVKIARMRFFPLVAFAGLLCCFASPASAQQLHCKPCWHNFEKVPVGSSVSFSIQLSNTGTKALKIISKSEQGASFSYGKFSLPITLQPGATTQVPIIFTPKSQGFASGVFELNSTARNFQLTMHASGVGQSSSNPQLSVSPSTLNFGSVTVGSSESLQATLTASNAAVTVSSDQSTSSEFAIMGLTLPVTIAAGQSIPVTIQFTPNASGTATAKAGFTSNAVNSPTVEHLTGTGVAQTSHNVYLSWEPGDGNAVGYNIYRGSSKGGPFTEINSALDSSTNYTDYTVVSGDTYYYVATEVNAQGQESGYSNVAKAVIPNP